MPADQNYGPDFEASPDATPIGDSTRTVVKVLLVDDHAVVRTGLKTLLKAAERVEIVGEASSGEEAVEKAATLEPDIVVMDRAMPGMDGIEATRRITALELGARILVLAIHDEDEFLVPALKAGATGFLRVTVEDSDGDLAHDVEWYQTGGEYNPDCEG
ncbi:MAG: response regulator transcription factor [Gammaproteobacteria bacterium]|nr:response regulator transcription factor [Gammaproteobacteria bacterium]MYC51378.1 response regulator transcription factor [Gammaproteobacteria bacterium]